MKSDGWREKMFTRVSIVAVLFSCIFLLLALRLWQVQVLHETDHRISVNRQSVRPVRLNPVRGRIYAADDRALVDNRAVYDLVFYVSDMRRPGTRSRTIDYILECEQKVMALIGRSPALTAETVERHIIQQPVLPLMIAQELSESELAKFSEAFPLIPGVEIQPRVRRDHCYAGLASHVLGFTGWKMPDGKDVMEGFPRVYVQREMVGRSGLEQVFDKELAGLPGARLVRVDSIGYAREFMGAEKRPVDGCDLYLTLDIDAQTAAERVLQGHAGALVVLDVSTGAVVAMASSPSFDLTTLTSATLTAYFNDEQNKPMLNRATRGVYVPGSIVKPLVALAALEAGIVYPLDTYECNGKFQIGDHVIRCAARYGHGVLNISRAIVVSCNPFFLNLGVKCGLERLANYFEAAGFGAKTGFELSDLAGLSPSQELARRFWKRKWLAVDTAYASMGQGGIAITPLQAAVYAAALANGGIVFRPFVVRKICTQDGELQAATLPEIRNRIPVSEEHLRLVQNAMHHAVTDRDGGARGLQASGFDLAGKTGTAEVGSGENRHKNAWAIVFGPYDDPKYAVACVIEHGDTGGKTAVPVVADFFRFWLNAGE